MHTSLSVNIYSAIITCMTNVFAFGICRVIEKWNTVKNETFSDFLFTARNVPIEYTGALFAPNNVCKTVRRANILSFFFNIHRQIILDATTSFFQ